MTNNQKLKEIISSFKTNRVAVIGDLILDVYVWGNASRISQEAPVPVVHVNKKTERLGGAANVMCNIVTLGANAHAFGVTGHDQYSQEIKRLMKEFNIDYSGVYIDKKRSTTMKQRVIAASQQLVRIDYEDISDVSAELKKDIVSQLKDRIKSKEIDAVIFEDYAKGMLDSDMAAEICAAARDAGVFVALDPHPGHPLEISGITIMTPNKSEAFGLAGIYHPNKENEKAEIEQAAKVIQQKWDPDHLLITLGAQGMALFSKGEQQVVIPTRAREVFDVSGAGDTVIATFTLAMLSGATALEAAEIANHAAGVVVGKVGTVSVSDDELLNSF
jgi:D-beta-D-heptose 7-phosphate kinase/D-beta-D-heptose 1-phosphate adenosyltransferase